LTSVCGAFTNIDIALHLHPASSIAASTANLPAGTTQRSALVLAQAFAGDTEILLISGPIAISAFDGFFTIADAALKFLAAFAVIAHDSAGAFSISAWDMPCGLAGWADGVDTKGTHI
jgi:hypothetical protein